VTGGFDFEGFGRATRGLDANAWLSYLDDEAEWIEYKHSYPPRSPRLIRGKEGIGAFLGRIATGGITLGRTPGRRRGLGSGTLNFSRKERT